TARAARRTLVPPRSGAGGGRRRPAAGGPLDGQRQEHAALGAGRHPRPGHAGGARRGRGHGEARRRRTARDRAGDERPAGPRGAGDVRRGPTERARLARRRGPRRRRLHRLAHGPRPRRRPSAAGDPVRPPGPHGALPRLPRRGGATQPSETARGPQAAGGNGPPRALRQPVEPVGVGRMEFGLALDLGTERTTLDRVLDEYVPLLDLAERQGFTSVWAGETYPTGPGYFHLPSPLLALAAPAPR